MAERELAALPARCRCGQVPPKDCPLHGDDANRHSHAEWARLVENTGARPGGPLRAVTDDEQGESRG